MFIFDPNFIATGQICSNKAIKSNIKNEKDNETDITISSENNSGETDIYEDSSSISLPDSIDGDGPNYTNRNSKQRQNCLNYCRIQS